MQTKETQLPLSPTLERIFKMNHSYFSTKRIILQISEMLFTFLIATALAIVMIGMVFGASIQESDKLHAMDMAEVQG